MNNINSELISATLFESKLILKNTSIKAQKVWKFNCENKHTIPIDCQGSVRPLLELYLYKT
jgi:hypothetical protein